MSEDKEISFFPTVNKEMFDSIVYQCGMEKCKPSYSYGPAVRDHYLIHFILEGRGKFYVNGKSYLIEKNQGFLICPNIITYYEADYDNPWVYTWVGFNGIKAEEYLKLANLSFDNPVFHVKETEFIKQCLYNMRQAINLKFGRELRMQGLLLLFLSQLIEESDKEVVVKEDFKKVYIKKTLQFIEMNYNRKITIEEMADNIGINKNYFSNLFKEFTKMTPQQCLIRFRINKACELLENESLTISDVSRSVGYNDPLGFSKIFKKEKNISPKKYRESIKLINKK